MALYLRYAVRSDLGLVRNNNEDSVYAGPRLIAIADGMGGHAAGEVASKIVIGTLEPLDEDRRIDDLVGALRDAVVKANNGIADAVKASSDLEGMGTTLTAMRFVGSQVGLVHVGDSRGYMLREDELSQITHDDTYVQYLVDSGKLTPEEAKDHPRKSVILRALLGTEVEPDVSIREARPGDRYMLCSDGLSDVVSAETIADTLRIDDPQEAADRLVELALRGGGPDNVTVVVADVLNAKVGDIIEDVPVIAGAFVDPAAADIPKLDADVETSPAERAAAISRARPVPVASGGDAGDAEDEAAPVTGKRRRRWSWRPWLLIGVIIVIVAALLAGTYAWTQSQYYVGKADADVAIYRGVNTDLGPVDFSSVYRVSSIEVSDLTPAARSQVNAGITARNEADAERIIGNLRGQLLPLCRQVEPSSSIPASGTTAATGSSPTSSGSSSGSGARRTLPAGRSPSSNGTREATPQGDSVVPSSTRSAGALASALASGSPSGAISGSVGAGASGSASGSATGTASTSSGRQCR